MSWNSSKLEWGQLIGIDGHYKYLHLPLTFNIAKYDCFTLNVSKVNGTGNPKTLFSSTQHRHSVPNINHFHLNCWCYKLNILFKHFWAWPLIKTSYQQSATALASYTPEAICMKNVNHLHSKHVIDICVTSHTAIFKRLTLTFDS